MLDADLQLRRGHFTRHVRIHSDARLLALAGPSGAGKTSVLNAIAGLLRPVAGRIAVDGVVLFDSAAGIDVPVHRRRIGYVFQDARLFPHLDVRGNLRYGTHGRNAGARFGFEAVVELLGIGPLLQRRPRNLSGGEAQRVAIGRALLSDPQCLLLDEPLASLDEARRLEILEMIGQLHRLTAIPILYVSHDRRELDHLGGDVVEMA